MAKFNTGQSFADGDTVTGAKLNNITSQLDIYTGVISEQTAMAATVSTADQLLIADTDSGDSGAANRVTVQKLLNDTLTNGTFTNVNLTGNLNVTQLSTLGTINSTRGTVGILNSTTGTIATLNSTTGTIPTLTTGTTTSTAANITNGTIQTLTASTATITGGTYSGAINSTTGTIATFNSTTGTIATLNSTTGTIATGTIATLNSTTGTITNLSTTLAGDFTISQGTGTIGTAKVTPTNLSQPFTSGTAVISTSGTAIDFTGIPSWVKRITVMFNGVSTSGASTPWLIQLGDSGGIENTGYLSAGGRIATASASSVNSTAGFSINVNNVATNTIHGSMTITLIDSSNNSWVASGAVANSAAADSFVAAGSKSLSATLDRVRITTSGGSDTFDAGSINIMYEG